MNTLHLLIEVYLRKNEGVEDRLGHNRRRVPADDGDDLVSIHLQPGMEPHYYVVGEHSERILKITLLLL